MTAKEKADSLCESFNAETTYDPFGNDNIHCAIKTTEEVILALNSVKGMGKIHKVKFWKNVKKELELKL